MTRRTRTWSLVIPLKPLDLAKSRLSDLSAGWRQGMVAAMALDVRDAVLACREIAEVVVVSRDPRWRTILGHLGIRMVADAPDDSLNDALRRGAAACCHRSPDHGIAALTADLPSLRPSELRAALRRSSACTASFVADARGEGTTLFAAPVPALFDPRYGDSSRIRHLDAGACELEFPRRSGLRQDVDTLDDLAAAQALGLGRHTRAVLGERGRAVTAGARL